MNGTVCQQTFYVPKEDTCEKRSVRRDAAGKPKWGVDGPEWDETSTLKGYTRRTEGDSLVCEKETTGACRVGSADKFDTLCPENSKEGWCSKTPTMMYADENEHTSFYPSLVTSKTVHRLNSVEMPVPANKNTCKTDMKELCTAPNSIANSARANSARDVCEILQKKKQDSAGAGGFPDPWKSAAEMFKTLSGNNDEEKHAIRDVMTEQQVRNYLQNRSACENNTKIRNSNIVDNTCEADLEKARLQMQYELLSGMSGDDRTEMAKLFAQQEKERKKRGPITITQTNDVKIENDCRLNALMKSASNAHGDIDSSVAQTLAQEALGLMSSNESSQSTCEVISTKKSACSYMENIQCCFNNTTVDNENVVKCAQNAVIDQSNSIDTLSVCQIAADTSLSQEMIESIRTSIQQDTDQIADSGLNPAAMLEAIMKAWATIAVAFIVGVVVVLCICVKGFTAMAGGNADRVIKLIVTLGLFAVTGVFVFLFYKEFKRRGERDSNPEDRSVTIDHDGNSENYVMNKREFAVLTKDQWQKNYVYGRTLEDMMEILEHGKMKGTNPESANNGETYSGFDWYCETAYDEAPVPVQAPGSVAASTSPVPTSGNSQQENSPIALDSLMKKKGTALVYGRVPVKKNWEKEKSKKTEGKVMLKALWAMATQKKGAVVVSVFKKHEAKTPGMWKLICLGSAMGFFGLCSFGSLFLALKNAKTENDGEYEPFKSRAVEESGPSMGYTELRHRIRRDLRRARVAQERDRYH